MKLSETQIKHLEWLADDEQEFGPPGGRRTFQALCRKGMARINFKTMRWEITDVGRLELGPIELTDTGYDALPSQHRQVK